MRVLIADSTYVYIYGRGPIGMVDAQGNAYYFLRDGLGSVTGIVDASGTLTATYSYDAYGNLRSSTGTLPNAFRYTGEWFDAETGLYYLRARYYDPAVGRFITRDPWPGNLTRPYSQNPYLYVENNPTNLIDPMGLDTSGVGFVFSLGIPGLGGTVGLMIVSDDRGNAGLLLVGGGGGTTGGVRSMRSGRYTVPTISAGVALQYTRAHSIFSLASPTTYLGGSVGEMWGIGADVLAGENPDCSNYYGLQVQLQATTKGPIPVEVHGGVQPGRMLLSINEQEILRRIFNK